MAVEPELDLLDSVGAQALRSQYRCTMCHKHCPVPCRFTGAEFRALAATFNEGWVPSEVVPSSTGWGTSAGQDDH
jgi:hypothetical protein